jgi:hypothetical protein
MATNDTHYRAETERLRKVAKGWQKSTEDLVAKLAIQNTKSAELATTHATELDDLRAELATTIAEFDSERAEWSTSSQDISASSSRGGSHWASGL